MSPLEHALVAHRAGRLDEAESGYRLTLAHDAHHADALHMLGVIHLDRGALNEAETLIRKAIAVDERATFLGDLGNVLIDMQRMPEAEAAFCRAVEIDPSYALAHYNLGIAYMASNKDDEAERAFRRALENAPNLVEARINLGAVLFGAKRFAEATGVLTEALAIDPKRASVYRELGRLMIATSRYAQAEEYFREAVRLDPMDANAHNGLAAALMRQERPEEAEIACRQALALDPQCVEAQVTLGAILLNLNLLPEAEAGLREVLKQDGMHTLAHFNLAAVLQKQGNTAEAQTLLRRVVEQDPWNADAQCKLGNLLAAATRHAEAEVYFREAIRLKPVDAIAHSGLAVALMKQARPDDAERAYRQALTLDLDLQLHEYKAEVEAWLRQIVSSDPSNAAAQRNLGRLLLGEERYAEAETCLREAIRLKPTGANVHSNLAAALMKLKRPEEAEVACRQALTFDPYCVSAQITLGMALLNSGRLAEAQAPLDVALRNHGIHPLAHFGLAFLLQEQGHMAEAETLLRQIITRDPSNVYAQWNLSLLLLANGRYEEGWALHELRRIIRHDGLFITPPPAVAFPEWRGEPLEGKTMIVMPEQGFGDTLQFCRYLPMLKRLGLKRLSVVCPSALGSLMQAVDGVDMCIASADAADLPAHDYWCFMMSLPFRFNTTINTVPAAVPYLHTPQDRLKAWQNRLPSDGFKVGLVWAGNPRAAMPQNNAIDRRRSLDVRAFLPLLQVPDVVFVSLQMGDAARSQLAALPQAIRPLDPMGDVADFSDTAAIIECLDLVITVDTSIAHLAGGLGRPVWILSRFDACWRWLRNRQDSPWYPSARLFGQQTLGEWGDVIERITRELRHTSETARR